MYDTGYFDEEESAREVSTRARRTRKGASDTARPNLDRQTSKQSLDDLSRKEKTDGGIKRRGTKKIDVEKTKTAVGEKNKTPPLAMAMRNDIVYPPRKPNIVFQLLLEFKADANVKLEGTITKKEKFQSTRRQTIHAM